MLRPSHVILLIVAVLGLASPAGAQLAVRGRVYPMAGPLIEDGIVLIRDGKIAAVGPASTITIPAGFRLLEAGVITPGLIDARGTVGLTGYLNQPQDQDQLDHSGPIQPELRAIDAYNAQDPLVKWVRDFGVTTVHTGHAPGELVAGQTCIVKTVGETVEQAVFVPTAAVAATLGESAQKGGDKSPGSRAKMMSMLREQLIKAREYLDKKSKSEPDKAPDRDLRLEMLGEVLQKKLPLMVNAHRAQDIANALRLAKEFDFKLVIDGGAESYLLIDELRAANVPVILHATMARSWGELKNSSFTTAARLKEAGIQVAIQSGFEDYVPKTRVVLFEAAIAAANGLGLEGGLATITIDAARILGISDRVGSLEVGKDGDLALYDGDPFEYTTHCVGVVINGVEVSSTRR
jgi:imidazolonepropionase-like amidohydrolase